MKSFSTFSIFALATTLVSATPQPQVTPDAGLQARSYYDTGLTAGGVRIYFTKDPIGELKSAEATGGDIRSLASETASVGVIEGLQSIRPFTSTVDAQATSSVSAEVYSLYNVAASIAELDDSAAYKSAGEAYTASLIDSLSGVLATATGLGGGSLGGSNNGSNNGGGVGLSDSSTHFAVPALLSVLAAISASAWMVL